MRSLRIHSQHWFRTAASTLLTGLLLVALATLPANAQKPEVFNALAASPNGPTTPITITIRSYSTRQQAQALAETLASGGQEAMLRLLEKSDVGRIARTGNIGEEINFIRSRPTATGRRITLVLARNITFVEAWHGTRSRDYPFSVIVLDLDQQNKGTGVLMVATKITFKNADTIETEYYGSNPVRLMSVRPQ